MGAAGVTYKARCALLRKEIEAVRVDLLAHEQANERLDRQRESALDYAAAKERKATDAIIVESEMRRAWTVRGYNSWWEFLVAHDRFRDGLTEKERAKVLADKPEKKARKK